MLEYDSPNDSNFIKELGRVTFDDNGDAKIVFNTNNVKAELQKLWFEGDDYELYFGILKQPEGLQFADMLTRTIKQKEYYFPKNESKKTGKETGDYICINGKKEIVSVKFYDSTGDPAYRVYNYSEKISLHIQTKNMGGDMLEFHFVENKNHEADKEYEKRLFNVDPNEIVDFDLDIKDLKSKNIQVNAGIRSFYIILKNSNTQDFLFPPVITDVKAFNPMDRNYFNHLKLSDSLGNIINSKLKVIAPVVLGESLEGGRGEGNCGGKYCIKVGDRNELIREISIRLAGFGGCTPDNEYTIKTQTSLVQFQRDFMRVSPTGKICGNTLKAIDEFCNKYKEEVSDYRCPCQNTNNSKDNDKAILENRCLEGWGKGLHTEEYMNVKILEVHRKYEYPGMHRCTLWAVSAMKFYLDFTKSKYKKFDINRGYRCWADNNFHSRPSTNHFGKAADIRFSKDGKRIQAALDMNEIRKTIFNKYLNAKWWGNPNFFTLEKESDGAATYVHVDCRYFAIKYMDNRFFVKTQDKVIGKSIIDLATEMGYLNTCKCSGNNTKINDTLNTKCLKCSALNKLYKGKEREDFYNSFGEKAIHFIESKGSVNKFKALYFIAQRRQENSFKLETSGNNPMNIKGKGDLGTIRLETHETLIDVYTALPQNFANFSSEQAGFQGYLDLLQSNYSDAFKAVTDNTKTIDDFTGGLEDTGKLGSYASGKAGKEKGLTNTEQYKKAVKDNFNSVLSDYKKWYECKQACLSFAFEKQKIESDIKLLNELK